MRKTFLRLRINRSRLCCFSGVERNSFLVGPRNIKAIRKVDVGIYFAAPEFSRFPPRRGASFRKRIRPINKLILIVLALSLRIQCTHICIEYLRL